MSIYSQLFGDSSSDDDEVTSELAVFAEACEWAYNATTPTVSRITIERDHVGAHNRLVDAYFIDGPQYNERRFRQRFRMSRNLFTRIVRELTDAKVFFQHRLDALKEPSISALMKCTCAIRQLAYGCVPDSLDEYLQMGETTARDCLKFFCKTVMRLYGEEYLRKPTYTDMEKLYAHHNQKHGFLGMLGSIDCTDWPWENCPVAFKAQHSRGDHGPDPFILLEAIAFNDLWIWHAFFGVSGMNNDVNVLRQSPIYNDLKAGRAPDVPFEANNVPYKRGYYLTDGIYPQWSVLIKSIKNPPTNDHKRILYKTMHEASKKDVERAFGVLKKKWKIIKYPARGMTRSGLSDIMYTCLILHNMIIQDNGEAICAEFFPEEQHRAYDPVRAHQESMQVTQEIINKQVHIHLKSDLVEHVWNNRDI